MAVPITEESQRKYPLNQPEGWKPKMARYTLRLPSDVAELAIANIGVQGHNGKRPSQKAVDGVEAWIKAEESAPLITDRFEMLFGRDQPDAKVYACYWTSKTQARHSLNALNFRRIFGGLSDGDKQQTGLWLEYFEPDLNRFETNYSGDDYQPGLAQLPKIEQASHDLTGYWGAARDRMRASAYDRFDDSDISSEGTRSASGSPPPAPSAEAIREHATVAPAPPNFEKSTLNTYISGQNGRTISHIRSGQFWENCPQEESDAYEQKLEPHLLNGMHDVLDHPVKQGDFGLRFLRNIPNQPQSHTRKETCALGFFRSLQDLENWAKDCPSHHKIFGGALSHRNRFGDGYKMRTWHEICVLKPGEAKWEYVNCDPGTGILPFVESDVVEDLSCA